MAERQNGRREEHEREEPRTPEGIGKKGDVDPDDPYRSSNRDPDKKPATPEQVAEALRRLMEGS